MTPDSDHIYKYIVALQCGNRMCDITEGGSDATWCRKRNFLPFVQYLYQIKLYTYLVVSLSRMRIWNMNSHKNIFTRFPPHISPSNENMWQNGTANEKVSTFWHSCECCESRLKYISTNRKLWKVLRNKIYEVGISYLKVAIVTVGVFYNWSSGVKRVCRIITIPTLVRVNSSSKSSIMYRYFFWTNDANNQIVRICTSAVRFVVCIVCEISKTNYLQPC